MSAGKVIKHISGELGGTKNIVKYAGIGLGAVIVLIILYFVFQKIKLKMQTAANKIVVQKAVDDEIALVLESGGKATITEAQALSLANDLKVALYGVDGNAWTEDEDAIYGVYMSLNETLDVLLLEKRYGVDDKGYDIKQALRKYLSIGELKKINSILSSKGIEHSYPVYVK